MVAIAGPQSGWNPAIPGDPVGSCPGCSGPSCIGDGLSGRQSYTSWGLFQIHNSTQPYLQNVTRSTDACSWATWLYDPLHNTQAAYWLYQQYGGGNTALNRAWGGANSRWETAAVQAAFPQARIAVQQAIQGASQSSGSAKTPPLKSKPPNAAHGAGLTGWQWAALGSGVVGLGVVGGWWWHTHRASFSTALRARYDRLKKGVG